MSKQVVIQQNNFSGGISDDPRIQTSSGFVISKHFDIFSNPKKLIPYRSFESDTNDGSTSTGMKQYIVRDFLYASASSKLYGLGQNASGYTKIVYKSDATTGNWTLPSSSEGTSSVKNGCFVEYKDYLWGFQGTNSVWKYGTLSGTPTITNGVSTTIGTVYNTVTAVSISAAGSGYNINDVLTIVGGSNTARCIVTSVSSGTVTGVSIIEPGYNYSTGVKSTVVSPEGGTGCTINVTTVANTTTTISSVAQGVIAKDDNLYLPYNNVLARVYPSGVVQDQVLKLPTYLKITSICNLGNYLAIGCAPKDPYNGVSKVYLWNLTSPDVQESIDWGEGELRILENVEGMLVGITDRYLNNSVGAGRGSLIIQGYSGGTPQVLKEVFTQKLTGTSIPLSKTVKNNRVFFCAKIITNSSGTEYNEGVWSFGRKNASYPYSLTLDYISENVNSSGIQAFGAAANFFFLAHSNDGSIDKTDDTATYSFSSILETQIIDFGETENDKRLDFVKVNFRKLASGESVTLKYKVDDATTWTTIGTYSTTGKLSKTFTLEEGTGKAFTSGREYKFQIISTGGAEITGYKAVATVLSNI